MQPHRVGFRALLASFVPGVREWPPRWDSGVLPFADVHIDTLVFQPIQETGCPQLGLFLAQLNIDVVAQQHECTARGGAAPLGEAETVGRCPVPLRPAQQTHQ